MDTSAPRAQASAHRRSRGIHADDRHAGRCRRREPFHFFRRPLAARVTSSPTPQLRRSLGFFDLLLFYIATTFSLRWMATAAAAGPSALVIWIIAAIGLFVPLVFTVLELSSRRPWGAGLRERPLCRLRSPLHSPALGALRAGGPELRAGPLGAGRAHVEWSGADRRHDARLRDRDVKDVR
jgi:hypothetical protein